MYDQLRMGLGVMVTKRCSIFSSVPERKQHNRMYFSVMPKILIRHKIAAIPNTMTGQALQTIRMEFKEPIVSERNHLFNSYLWNIEINSPALKIAWMHRRLHKERTRRRYSDQKLYTQHKHQQKKNNQKTMIGRKTTIWIFQATTKRNLTREDLHMIEKTNPLERTWNPSKTSSKQWHQDNVKAKIKQNTTK